MAARVAVAGDPAGPGAEAGIADAMRVVEDVPDSILVIGPDQRIAGQNPAHAIRFGWPDEELLGRRLEEYLGGESAQVVWEHVQEAGWYRGRVLAQARGGERTELELSAATFRDAGGGYAGAMLTMRPLAGPRGLAERLLEAVVDATSGTVGEEFLRDLVASLARTLQVRIGFLAEVIEGDAQRVRVVEMYDDGRFVEPFEYDVADTPCGGLLERRLCHFPRDVHLQFPKDHWLKEHGIRSYMAIRLEDSAEATLGHLGIMADCEMRHDVLKVSLLQIFAVRVAAEIERVRAERALAAHSRRLSEINAELDTFAAVVSHDLKAPLRQITGFLGLLSERHGDELSDGGLRLIELAVGGSARMSDLIDDLLAYARLNANLPTPVELRLTDAIAAARADAPSLNEAPDVHLEIAAAVGQAPMLRGQPTLLAQLIRNLLGNAVKYRGPGTLKIEVDAKIHDDEWVDVVVRDNGIGIEPRFSDAVFQIFRRLHTRDEYGGGTGVGLAICRKIARSHGGDIWVAPASGGQGTQFTVRLPRA